MLLRYLLWPWTWYSISVYIIPVHYTPQNTVTKRQGRWHVCRYNTANSWIKRFISVGTMTGLNAERLKTGLWLSAFEYYIPFPTGSTSCVGLTEPLIVWNLCVSPRMSSGRKVKLPLTAILHRGWQFFRLYLYPITHWRRRA